MNTKPIVKRPGLTLSLAMLSLFATGCAATTTQIIETNANYEKVFVATKTAASQTSFALTGSSKEDGTITAQRDVGDRKALNLNVAIDRESNPIKIRATIIPPSGHPGSIMPIVKEFDENLQNNLPDVKITMTTEK